MLKGCLEKLLAQGVDILSVVTCKHTGVAFLMRNVTPTWNISMMCGIYCKWERFTGLYVHVFHSYQEYHEIFL